MENVPKALQRGFRIGQAAAHQEADKPVPGLSEQVSEANARSIKQVAGATYDEGASIVRNVAGMVNPLAIPQMGYKGATRAWENAKSNTPPSLNGVAGSVGVDLPGANAALADKNVPSFLQKIGDPVIQAMLARHVLGKLPNAEGMAFSKDNAIAKLDNVTKVAGKNPVDITAPSEVAMEGVRDMRAGGVSYPLFNKWMARVRANADMTFEEARDFYRNATRKLSPEETSKLQGTNTLRLRAKFAEQLHQALTDSAEISGKGAEYASGINEYHNAMQIRRAGRSVGKTALAATGAGAAYGVGSYLYHTLSGMNR